MEAVLVATPAVEWVKKTASSGQIDFEVSFEYIDTGVQARSGDIVLLKMAEIERSGWVITEFLGYPLSHMNNKNAAQVLAIIEQFKIKRATVKVLDPLMVELDEWLND